MSYEHTPKLWIPGQNNSLENEYPIPTQDELTRHWQEYDPSAHIIDAPGVYGVMAAPQEAPRAYVSLDVCEVMRDSHLAIRSIIFANEERFEGNIHQYAAGTCLESAADITAVLRVLMNNGLVKPVKGIEEIADIIAEVADMGAYVFANTSTLPGCEPGTIEFFKQHIPVGMQGVAFPRNHAGDLPLTKGHVLKNIIEHFPSDADDILAVKIDDSPHHNIAARKEVGNLPNSKIVTIMPEYPTHYDPDPGSIATPTPLDAFQEMRRVVKEHLS